MYFDPKTEAEVSQGWLLPNGQYPFQVRRAEEKTSKVKPDGTGGHPMIELDLVVFHNNKEYKLRDWLVSTPGMAFKIRHFAFAVGLGDKYESGSFSDHDCVAREGYLELITQARQDGKGDQNSVRDYAPAVLDPKTAPARIESPRPQKQKFTPPPADTAVAITEDSIPF